MDGLAAGNHIVVNGIDSAGESAGHTFRTYAASQAARRFALRRFIVVPALNFCKVADALFDGKFRQGDARLYFDLAARHAIRDLLTREFHNGQFGFVRGLEVFPLQITQDGLCRLVPAGNRFDHEGRAGYAVPSREHAGARGGKCIRINGDGLALGHAHACIIGDERQARALPDREDNCVAWDGVI